VSVMNRSETADRQSRLVTDLILRAFVGLIASIVLTPSNFTSEVFIRSALPDETPIRPKPNNAVHQPQSRSQFQAAMSVSITNRSFMSWRNVP
jgi:hypothetical protein